MNATLDRASRRAYVAYLLDDWTRRQTLYAAMNDAQNRAITALYDKDTAYHAREPDARQIELDLAVAKTDTAVTHAVAKGVCDC